MRVVDDRLPTIGEPKGQNLGTDILARARDGAQERPTIVRDGHFDDVCLQLECAEVAEATLVFPEEMPDKSVGALGIVVDKMARVLAIQYRTRHAMNVGGIRRRRQLHARGRRRTEGGRHVARGCGHGCRARLVRYAARIEGTDSVLVRLTRQAIVVHVLSVATKTEGSVLEKNEGRRSERCVVEVVFAEDGVDDAAIGAQRATQSGHTAQDGAGALSGDGVVGGVRCVEQGVFEQQGAFEGM